MAEAESTTSTVKKDKKGNERTEQSVGVDGHFISLLAPKTRITVRRRIHNTLYEGEYFWPQYQYLTPYICSMKGETSGENKAVAWGGVNMVADFIMSRAEAMWQQCVDISTSMRISNVVSIIKSAPGAQMDLTTVSGNNSPYLNIGRDTLNIMKTIGCQATPQSVPTTETAIRGNNIYSMMHNGGIYDKSLLHDGIQYEYSAYGVNQPYSLMGDVSTLHSASPGSYSIGASYSPPDGHSFLIPSMKIARGDNRGTPMCVQRLPFSSNVTSPVNKTYTDVGSNPVSVEKRDETGDLSACIRDISTIPYQNLNANGEAIMLWVNPLDSDSAAGANGQKAGINFMMEYEINMDMVINYYQSNIDGTADKPYRADKYVIGKVVAMPSQPCPDKKLAEYWAYGDALRHSTNKL